MEDKIVVEEKYIENNKVALKSNAVFLAIGIALFVVYALFSVVLLKHIVAISSSASVDWNIFQKIVFIFDSKIFLYVLLGEFMSVAMIALFLNASDSEVCGIFTAARVFLVLSVATIFVPLFVLVIVI
ncbi:MAG: hypothetical protein ACI4M6_03745 [Christensenellaceae bacterium]